MLILVDQDGPLADFEAGFHAAWRAARPGELHIPVASRRGWSLEDQYPPELVDACRELMCEPGFFRGLPPVAGAVAAMEAMRDAGHDVRICTAPLTRFENCVAEKYHWVTEHLGPAWTKRMIVTKDKTLVRGDVLIDDKPQVTGSLEPVWRHILFASGVHDPAVDGTLPERTLTWDRWRDVLAAV